MIMMQTNRHYNKRTKENNLLCTSKTVVVFTDPIPLLSFPTLSNPFPATAAEKQQTNNNRPRPHPHPTPKRERERLRGREKKRDRQRGKEREREREREREGEKRGTCLVWWVRVRRRNGNWSDFQLVPTEGVSKSMQEEKAALIKHYLGEWISANEGKRQPKAFIDS